MTTKADAIRINEGIAVPLVRLIGAAGEHLGEKPAAEAIALARAAGLDLVEIVANSTPPVCKILDFGKYKYNQKKKDRKTRSHADRTDLKEMRLRTKIETHDFEVKMTRIRRFLTKGHRVKLSVIFRGREITHVEIGHRLLDRARAALAKEGKVIQEPILDGKFLGLMIDPIR
ncbi:MAG: translation initiation factor IF-3 [Candidatus Lindowbacteria bacterium RIFCSPLOWO2_12_FULL_62_27]|nr:MAG: translation initiation factor IF-3 [Candidatus Lindowbacteria bacterium RIFCSPLOWO2_12_FULL_62_27]